MTKQDVRILAEEYVLKHKERFKTGRNRVTKKEINAAVEKVAKALEQLATPRAKDSAVDNQQERVRRRAA